MIRALPSVSSSVSFAAASLRNRPGQVVLLLGAVSGGTDDTVVLTCWQQAPRALLIE